jgi:hypothetical protein
LGKSANGVVRHRAEHMNHVWCYDFVHDQMTNGRTLKMLTLEDEFTRECLAPFADGGTMPIRPASGDSEWIGM